MKTKILFILTICLLCIGLTGCGTSKIQKITLETNPYFDSSGVSPKTEVIIQMGTLKNLKFVNCTIESLQGLCYIDNLTMENCKLINTTLSFEYASNVNADITTKIDSVFNPISGTISAPEIEILTVEPDMVDPDKTKIICKAVGKKEEVVEWRRDRK